jgi:hypothetical protein
MITGCAALLWTPDEIRVLTPNGEYRRRTSIAPDDRYCLRLISDDAGRLYLRTVDNRQPFAISLDQGRHFEPVLPIPAARTVISPYNYKVHPSSAVITALEPGQLWSYSITSARWESRDLPPDLHVRDVSFDANDGLWCAGSVASRRIPGEETEAAVRYQWAPAAAFESRSPRLGVLDAAKVIRQGGLAELRTIDAASDPVVATSICSWLLDDSSSFVFVFKPKKTHVQRLKGEMICRIDRSKPGALRVFTHQGTVWQQRWAIWNQSSLVQPIVKSLARSTQRILIRGMDACQETIATAVELSRPEDQEPELTALCVSESGGTLFEGFFRRMFNNAEILDVALLR